MRVQGIDASLLLAEADDDWPLDRFLDADPPARRWPTPSADALIDEMVFIIARDFDPVSIILFGSRARGDHRPSSDVDLLIVLPHIRDRREAVVSIATSLCYMPLAKDIFVTTNEEIAEERDQVGSLIGQALHEGKLLYDRRSAGAQGTPLAALRSG